MIYGQDYAKQPLLFIFFLGIIAACLLVASIMDLKTHTVYNYIWWIMGAAGMVRLYIEVPICENENVWQSLFLFIFLQERFFCKMYGRADCHGFVACALAGASFGMGLKQFLLHMLIAFGLLGVVQLARKNVGRDGNLKEPVPFLPYISVAFGVNLIAYLCV